jgi:hypothetical protein
MRFFVPLEVLRNPLTNICKINGQSAALPEKCQQDSSVGSKMELMDAG